MREGDREGGGGGGGDLEGVGELAGRTGIEVGDLVGFQLHNLARVSPSTAISLRQTGLETSGNDDPRRTHLPALTQVCHTHPIDTAHAQKWYIIQRNCGNIRYFLFRYLCHDGNQWCGVVCK